MTNETTKTKSKYAPLETSGVHNDDNHEEHLADHEQMQMQISVSNDENNNNQETTRTKTKYAPLEISDDAHITDEHQEDAPSNRPWHSSLRRSVYLWILSLEISDAHLNLSEEQGGHFTDEDLEDASSTTPRPRHSSLRRNAYLWIYILFMLGCAGFGYFFAIRESSPNKQAGPMSPAPAPVAPHPAAAPPTESTPTKSPDDSSSSFSTRTDYGKAFYSKWKRMDLDDSIVRDDWLRDDWKIDIYYSLAMSDDGTVLAVGDPVACFGNECTGKAFVYQSDTSSLSSWSMTSLITKCDSCQNEMSRLGSNVQLSGDASILVVGGMSIPDQESLMMYRVQKKNKGQEIIIDYEELGPEWNNRTREYGGHRPTTIAFSKDASRFAIISSNRDNNATDTVQIFDWVDDQNTNDWVLQTNLVLDYEYKIHEVAMSADGKRVAFTGYDREQNAHIFDLTIDGQWIETSTLDMSTGAADCSGVGAWLEMSSNGKKIILVANCLRKPMTIVTFYQQPNSSTDQKWTPLHISHSRKDSEYAMDMSGDGNTFALVTYDPSDKRRKGRLEIFGWDEDSFWRPSASGVIFLGNFTFASAVALSQDGSTLAIATSNSYDLQSFLDVYQLL
jgi:hypothetical protein